MTVFTPVSHDEMVAGVLALAATLRVDPWRPTHLIGIGRGGLAPAVYLSHASGVPMLSVDFSGQVADFAAGALIRLAAMASEGERLLFLDDINDSGRTIGSLRRALADNGAPDGSVRFATLIDNRSSAEHVDYSARTIDRTTDKDWFVFPWEALAPETSLQADAGEVPERLL